MLSKVVAESKTWTPTTSGFPRVLLVHDLSCQPVAGASTSRHMCAVSQPCSLPYFTRDLSAPTIHNILTRLLVPAPRSSACNPTLNLGAYGH